MFLRSEEQSGSDSCSSCISQKKGRKGLLSPRNWPWTSFRVSWNQGRAKVDRATVLIELPKLVVPFSFTIYIYISSTVRFVTRLNIDFQYFVLPLTSEENDVLFQIDYFSTTKKVM